MIDAASPRPHVPWRAGLPTIDDVRRHLVRASPSDLRVLFRRSTWVDACDVAYFDSCGNYAGVPMWNIRCPWVAMPSTDGRTVCWYDVSTRGDPDPMRSDDEWWQAQASLLLFRPLDITTLDAVPWEGRAPTQTPCVECGGVRGSADVATPGCICNRGMESGL